MDKTFHKAAVGIMVLMIAFCIFAFFKSYFGLFPDVGHIDWIIHVHVITVCTWMLMLVVQPILIYKKEWELHRTIGKFSYAFVPFFMIICILTVRHMQLHSKEVFVFTVNIFMLLLFSVYYLLALYYRKRKPQWHGRLMLLTIIPFIGPATSRVKYDPHAIELAIIVTLLAIEFFRGRVFKPYVIGIACYVLLFIPFILLLMFKMDVMEWLWGVCFG
jgi:hypothetical protein